MPNKKDAPALVVEITEETLTQDQEIIFFSQGSDIKHLVPRDNNLDHRRFSDDKKLFLIELNKTFDNNLLSYEGANFNPYPLLVDEKLTKQMVHLHGLLIEAVNQVVRNYLIDKDIQAIISLPDRVVKLLELANETDYQIGAIRPDFLIDKVGNLKICEINARFPLNGFIMSEHLNEVVFQQNLVTSGMDSIDENNQITKLITNFFDLTKPISILKDKEKGYDINFLESHLKELSKQAVIQVVSPQQLTVDKSGIHNETNYCNQFVLELSQAELLGMNADVLTKIVSSSRYFNDIRTIFIGHDKRLLTVLRDEQIMKKYLSAEQFQQLQDYIIPTYILDEKVQKSIINDPAS
ncbi:MAG: hypothetical protein NY202_03780 [Mollicutes bacterium UO1]